MGNSPLDKMQARVEERSGKITVSGRYNKLPKRLEDDYDCDNKKVLGTGYNGAVFLATAKGTDRKYAVKSFHLHGVSREKKLELETEAEIFLGMDHPHVARLVDVYECDKHLNLVMECMEGGELFQRVQQRKRFSEVDAAHAVWQMLLSVNYIHNRGIVHRDLKLENFLYEKEDGDHLKLIDFGFSHIWAPNTKMALSCGTLAYVAPEVLQCNYTSQCDLWSLGVIVFILLVGYMPFSGPEKMQIKAIHKADYVVRKDRWRTVSEPAVDFVKKLLVADPKARLTATSALEHEWIADHESRRQAKDGSGAVDEGTASALVGFAEASQFRRACMSVMAWSLTNEQRAEVRHLFIEMDTTRSGTITMGEFKKVLTEKFKITDDQVKPIFDALDTSNNEEIHYSEFLAAMVSTRIAMHDDLLASTFKRFDVDNSGYITRDNLKSVLGESFDGSDLEKLIAEADTSKDGQISYDEFIAYLKGQDAQDGHQEVAERLIQQELAKPQGESEDKTQLNYDDKQGLKARGESEAQVGSGPAPASAQPAAAQPAAQPAPAQSVKKSKACSIL